MTEAATKSRPRGADKKEAYHQACEELVKPFKFRRPDDIPTDRKAFVRLGDVDNTKVLVQILQEGSGDNNLHYHANMDSVFYVLKGKIKFYGPNDEVYGDFGPNEGCLMPAGARYWFAASGKDEAWLLHMTSLPKGQKMSKRINSEGSMDDFERPVHYDGATLEVLKR